MLFFHIFSVKKKGVELKNMSKVIHFEIPADNPERAIKFYEDVFGWEIEKWELGDYWLIPKVISI